MKKMKIPGTDMTIGSDEPETTTQGVPVPTPEQFSRALGQEYEGYVQTFAEIDGVEYKILRHAPSDHVRVYVQRSDITAVMSDQMLKAFAERAGVVA